MILILKFLIILPEITNYFNPLGERHMTGKTLVILPETDSTNNHAMNSLRNGEVADGTVFFALKQTNGKGQRGKTWESGVEQNIILSLVWNAEGFNINRPFELSALVAIACQGLFERYALDGVTIKWPNDIYWNDRKAGGILIENIIKGEIWEKSVIGIGLNINQTDFPRMDRKAVSLKQITGKEHDPLQLARELCKELDHWRDEYFQHGFQLLLEKYNQFLFARGKAMKFRKGNVIVQARVEGVDNNGQLEVTHAYREKWDHGTIEWYL
jgi:BirA family biotin operon repressor/biotin-[acetyl-CoA-carboxylase] ligase